MRSCLEEMERDQSEHSHAQPWDSEGEHGGAVPSQNAERPRKKDRLEDASTELVSGQPSRD